MIPLALHPEPLPAYLDRQHVASLELVGAAHLIACALEGVMHLPRRSDWMSHRARAQNYLRHLLAGCDEHATASVRNAMAAILGEARTDAEIEMCRERSPEEVFRGL